MKNKTVVDTNKKDMQVINIADLTLSLNDALRQTMDKINWNIDTTNVDMRRDIHALVDLNDSAYDPSMNIKIFLPNEIQLNLFVHGLSRLDKKIKVFRDLNNYTTLQCNYSIEQLTMCFQAYFQKLFQNEDIDGLFEDYIADHIRDYYHGDKFVDMGDFLQCLNNDYKIAQAMQETLKHLD